MPKCRECDVDLVSEVNWGKSREKYNDKICRECEVRLKKVYLAKCREKNEALGEAVFDGTLKRCPGCKKEKPRNREFWNRNTSTWDGIYTICRDCVLPRRVATLAKYKDKNLLLGGSVFDGSLKTCSRCKEEKPRSREYWNSSLTKFDGINDSCLPCSKEKFLENNYGITQQDKEVLWEAQKRLSGVGKTPITSNGDANVDHDHDLGLSPGESTKLYTREQKRLSVNGLLTSKENTYLGFLFEVAKESGLTIEQVLNNTLEYLKNPPAKGVLWETR